MIVPHDDAFQDLIFLIGGDSQKRYVKGEYVFIKVYSLQAA